MILKVKSLLWRVILIGLTLTLWVSAVVAQQGTDPAPEDSTQFGIIWFILLAGLLAVGFLGFAMYSGDSSSDADSN